MPSTIAVLEPGVLDREHQLDAAAEVPRHPVGRGEENLGLVVVLEIRDARVLQELVDDAGDVDVLRDPGHARAQAADAADDQVDFHAGMRRRVEGSIAAGSTSEFILAMIRAGRPALAWCRLAMDQRAHPVGQMGRSDDQLLPVGPASSRSAG